ncbi:helix-turn-helix transcriptional regulator [Dactylosporangium darangshiense]|uniref:Helix-turn-helix transcriptional regulator n=1 Tax=Dactylosporangium darangshiense TaxID=579108 RepID=A0ABP8D8F0_9ACTN
MSDEQRRRELAKFLRVQRARVRPRDVGLPESPGVRRTPGLRREEVAELSGVGLTWYTWLEQARAIPASPQVIDALARALRLGADRHAHLRALAGLPPPGDGGRAAGEPDAGRLARLVEAMMPNPASAYDVHWDYLAWNRAYAIIRHNPGQIAPERRNLLWMLLTDGEIRRRMPGWEGAARAVLGQFRAAAGRHAGEARFDELIAALEGASPEFRQWWAEYPVRDFRPATVGVEHPGVGAVELELFQLRPIEHPGALVVVQVPVGAADRERVTALLCTATP